MAIPKVTRTLYDNNLDRSVPQGPTNRRVVMLGTATDGPMYEPLQVKSPAEAAELFGAFGDGTLVRGLKECIDAQSGSQAAPDTWGMRIGGVSATRAVAELQTSGSVKVAEVEAINEGSIYNDITLTKAQDTAGKNWIYIYNPKTELSSKFEVTLNTDELCAAINVDPNTKDIIFAVSATADNAELIEFDASGGTYAAGKLTVDMAADATGAAGLDKVATISQVYTVEASAVYDLVGSALFNIPKGIVVDPVADADSGNTNEPTFHPIVGGTINETAKYSEVYYTGTVATTGVSVDSSGDAVVTLALGGDYMDSITGTIEADITVTDEGSSLTSTYPAETITVTSASGGEWALEDPAFKDLTVTVSFAFDTALNPKTLAVSATPSTEFQYKINTTSGTALRLGAIPVYTVKLRYAQKVSYENVAYEETDGTMVLTAPDLEDDAVVLGFGYTYLADDPDWTTAYSLAGGQNGTVMTNLELKADLDKAYEHFVSDFFDVMAVTDLTVDAVFADGTAAGYAEQMSTFLDKFNGEMIGVIGFEPLVGSGVGGRIKRFEDLSDPSTGRVAKLTVSGLGGSSSNAGTVLGDFNQPFMFAVDLEPIFSNNGVRYSGIGSAAVAGLIAGMPTEEAIYRHTLPGLQGLRYRYTEIDQVSGNRQVDILSDARISVGTIDNGAVKLTESRSLATAGSDFENLMTVLILQEALDICRVVAKDFIGKVSSEALLQAFQSSLDKQMGDTLVPRVLRGFSAPIKMTPGERVLGKITIPLTLSPQFEIRDVHYNVQLTAEDVA